jgi:holliday junction DNA helicase RuvA
MIATLKGEVAERSRENMLILEVGGVGYGLMVTSADLHTATLGSEQKLHVYEHIRENSFDLYGFLQSSSKQLFLQLLDVKNVGPKAAMAILDIADADTIRSNIAAGEVKFLQSAKGVGRRAAEQIIVELRDKVGGSPSEKAEQLVYRSGVNLQDEAVEALVGLGYSPQDAARALEKVDNTLSTEERVKQALRAQ